MRSVPSKDFGSTSETRTSLSDEYATPTAYFGGGLSGGASRAISAASWTTRTSTRESTGLPRRLESSGLSASAAFTAGPTRWANDSG